MKKLALIAVGGNSLIKDKNRQSLDDQYEAVRETTRYAVDLMEEGWNVILTHGNGPQVGFILLRSDLAKNQVHEIPLDVAGSDTQGAIGYYMQQCMQNELLVRGISRPVATIITQTVVDRLDPSFQHPTKPIGPFYTEAEAKGYAQNKGWVVTEDAGRGWRRVVASPLPIRIVEYDVIKSLVEQGISVIAAGGGGIPVIEDDKGFLKGVAAVIDKDRASSLLAADIGASLFIISTAVEQVCLNFGKPDQKALDQITVAQAKDYMAQGHFKPGSMLPKMEAAISFLERGGHEVIITSPEKMVEAVHGKTGTHILQ